MVCLSGTLDFLIVFQAEHNLLMHLHPFHMLGLAGVFSGSLFSAMHASLVRSGKPNKMNLQMRFRDSVKRKKPIVLESIPTRKHYDSPRSDHYEGERTALGLEVKQEKSVKKKIK